MADVKPQPIEDKSADEWAASIVVACLNPSDIEMKNGSGRWTRKAVRLRRWIADAITKARAQTPPGAKRGK